MGKGNAVIILNPADSMYDIRPSWDADTHLKRCKDVSCFEVNCSSVTLGN